MIDPLVFVLQVDVPRMLAWEPVVASGEVGVRAAVEATDHPPVTGYLRVELEVERVWSRARRPRSQLISPRLDDAQRFRKARSRLKLGFYSFYW